jgi:hypothetical protein
VVGSQRGLNGARRDWEREGERVGSGREVGARGRERGRERRNGKSQCVCVKGADVKKCVCVSQEKRGLARRERRSREEGHHPQTQGERERDFTHREIA